MSKWVADEQNRPLGPCGSRQLPSPASFHLVRPSPLLLALLCVWYGTSAALLFPLTTLQSTFLCPTPQLHFHCSAGFVKFLKFAEFQLFLFVVVRREGRRRAVRREGRRRAAVDAFRRRLNTSAAWRRCTTVRGRTSFGACGVCSEVVTCRDGLHQLLSPPVTFNGGKGHRDVNK